MYDMLLNVIWLGNTSTFEGIHELRRRAIKEKGHPNTNNTYVVKDYFSMKPAKKSFKLVNEGREGNNNPQNHIDVVYGLDAIPS